MSHRVTCTHFTLPPSQWRHAHEPHHRQRAPAAARQRPRPRQAIRYGAGDCLPADLHPVVKLFTPDAGATWLLTELDPDDPDLAFGLCDLGLGEPELGYNRLSELANARGPLRLRVERDRHFEADKPISAYAAEAHEHRRIRA